MHPLVNKKKYMITALVIAVVATVSIGLNITTRTAANSSSSIQIVKDQESTDSSARLFGDNLGSAAQLPSVLKGGGRSSSNSYLRADPQDQVRLNELNLSENLDELISEAYENPVFAYALAKALNECMYENDSFSSVELKLNSGSIQPDQAETALSDAEKRYQKCVGLESANTELQNDLAAMAAKAGVLDAQINYPTLAAPFITSEDMLKRPGSVEEFRSNSVNFARMAASTGTPEGLFHAYSVFSAGVITPADQRSAYGYLYAYDQLHPSRMGQVALIQLRQKMSDEDIQSAMYLANQIIR